VTLEQLAALGLAAVVVAGIGTAVVRRRRGAAEAASSNAQARRRSLMERDEDPIVASIVGQRPDHRGRGPVR
jgi:hypothetical protein